MQPSTSGGGKIEGEVEESDFNSDEEFDDNFIEEYCEKEIPKLMTVSKELFYTDTMVEKRYTQLSPLEQIRFDQMKAFPEQIKRETGDNSLIKDLMAKVVLQRFSTMQKEDLKCWAMRVRVQKGEM